MRYDAGKENWMPMEIRGVQGYFSDLRIDRASVPGWFHFWELADGDSDGTPCRYKPQILANFYGTFLTTGELPVDCRNGGKDLSNPMKTGVSQAEGSLFPFRKQ